MARFSLSFLAIFVVFAALALSLPTKTDDLTPTEKMGLDNTIDNLQAATKMMNGLDDKDTNNQKNDIETSPSSTQDGGDDGDDDDEAKENAGGEDDPEDKKPKATKTKKPTSGNFVTPTATHTAKPSSKANSLGKIPIIGGLLGGTGSGL
ncbi:hypothetical protein N7478_006785 [Penicillium angulare]|uniref:uncharacterized protein n=1 Tax=Penicillium angulare TaxID=116970 RepID=UPI002540C9F7|nr:uncharacterized protein N7478_006785 [Penicillium angulare]KAJ5281413.1 hypothetical protein N7478_006785 [Penicillium angulare]